ncbi:amidohydrolase family protein [Gallaecimonas sp. GXIMD4217]|uniref:amidohydrolase family protein n=1 Tax=Gallaecimonas sp. GXIMD4217 TaxID=3131927 RepID=UPI00311AC22A
MKNWLCILGLLAVPTLAHDMAPGEIQKRPVLITNATLHTADQGVLAGSDILFENGLITALGPDLPVPDKAVVIEASGKHVYPGLIALSTRLGLSEVDAVRATRDFSEVGDLTPEVAAEAAFNADSEIIPTVRANGIALAEVAPNGNLVAGRSAAMRLDGWNRRDMLVKADTGLHLYWPDSADSQALDGLKALFGKARAYDERRRQREDQPVDARLEPMRGLFSRQLPLFIHLSRQGQLTQALDFTAEQDLAWSLVAGPVALTALAELKARGVAVVATDPQGLPDHEDAPYDQAFTLPARLHQAGLAPVIALPAGWSARDLPFAVAQAMAWGLPEEAALRSVTLNAAKLLGIDQQYGSLALGKSATLILTAAPLFDYPDFGVEAMFIDGRKVNLDNRQKRLYRKYRQKGQGE